MTLTPHPTLAGLLRAVCENPADDAVRLVLADWYEENEQVERGELIRIQCELARLEQADQHWRTPVQRNEYDALRHREQELLCEHKQRWALEIFGPYLIHARLDNPHVVHGWTFRRGFPAEVSCRIVGWCGRECHGCPFVKWGMPCQQCHGTGRTDAHGPAIAQAAPIERVTLTHLEEVQALFRFTPQGPTLHEFFKEALTWARRQAGLPALS